MHRSFARREFLGLTATAALSPWIVLRGDETSNHTIPESINAFTFDLYSQLAANPGNVFFSAFSIELTLAMMAAGAGGTTLAELRKALHLTDDADETHAGVKSLLAALNKPGQGGEGPKLKIANAIWGQKEFPWDPEFQKLLRMSYDSGIQRVDFAKPDTARKTINEWVARQTNNKIQGVVAEGALTTMTKLVLANAIYFLGKWKNPFLKSATRDGPFTTAEGKSQEVPLMTQTASYGYFETKEYQAIELDYLGGTAGMIVLLPTKVDGLPALEKRITAKGFAKMAPMLEEKKAVELTLPSFKIEQSFDVKKILQSLGVDDAFAPAKADFSKAYTGKERLWIDVALHKVFVAVDEEGTEAAAVTAVSGEGGSGRTPEKVAIFRADHPFLFAIRHKPTNAILFYGRLDKV